MSNNKLTTELILSTIDKATAPLKRIRGGSRQTAQALREAKDRLRQLQDQQKDISSFRSLQRAAKDNREQLAQASETTRRLKQQLQATEQPSKRLTRQYEKATQRVSTLRQSYIRQLQTLKTTKRQFTEAGIDVRRLSQRNQQLETDIDAATAAVRRQQLALERLGKRQAQVARTNRRFSRTQELAGRVAGAGAATSALGGTLTYGTAQVLQPGMRFDESMSKVQALTRLDSNSAAFKQLRAQARELGATTSFTASDAAQGQGFLAMAGFTPQAIKQAMPGMLSLAKAAGQDLASTADIGSNILTGFNLKANQMGHVGDVMTAAFTRGNVNLNMLGETMKYVGPVASGLGISLEETAAMTDKLGDAGIQASQAGTSLRAIFSRLASPPKAAADALAQLNVQTKDAQGNLRPMADILAELNTKTAKMGNTQRTGLFKAIAGEEAFSSLQALTKQAGTGELQKLISTLQHSSGEAAKTAKVMSDNAAGDLQSLYSATQDVAIGISDLNKGSLRELIQSVTAAVRGIGQWVKENPKLAGTLTRIAAITGGLLLAFSALSLTVAALLGPFAILRWTFSMVGLQGGGLISVLFRLGRVALPLVGNAILWIGRALMMNPIGLAITAIAGAAYLIYRNWQPIKAFFLGLWQQVKAAFDGGLAGIGQLLINWSPLGLLYSGIQKALSALGINLPPKFTEFGSNLINGAINGITNKLKELKSTIVNAASSASRWFKEKLGIHSPSRVFASHGGNIIDGLLVGLGDGRRVSQQINRISSRVKQAGSAMALGALSLGANAAPLALDNRPPLALAGGNSASQSISIGEIHVHAAPGMNEQQLADLVAQEVARLQAGQAAAQRSNLSDED